VVIRFFGFHFTEVYGMDVKSIGLYGWVPYVETMFGAWFELLAKTVKKGWISIRPVKWSLL
jgi:hypothetical protein